MKPQSIFPAWIVLVQLVANTLEAGTSSFAHRDGAQIVLDGQPFAPAGVNCYYLMVYSVDASLRGAVNEVLDDAKALGANVVRTWAFNDGAGQWNALQTSPGVYSEKVFAGLDYVLKRASDKGLRLILSLVNNWDDYGGMNQYVAWSDTASTHDDFYTDASTRAWYKDHVTKVLTRVNSITGIAYRDDPAILGWELANEPRAESKGAAVLNAWVREMAAHVKAIDSSHLLSVGSEGFYGAGPGGKNPKTWMASSGADFIGSHSAAEIDYASFHSWPDSWSMSKAETVKWVKDHFADATNVLGKPAILGEFGKMRPVAVRDDFFRDIYGVVLDSNTPGKSSAGSLLWMLYHSASPDYDGFGVFYAAPGDASTVTLIQDSHRAIAARLAGPRFIRSDSSCDGKLDIADAMQTLEYLFRGADLACCAAAADSNGDGETDVSDVVYSLLYAFAGGQAPPAPFPACGAGASCETASGACASN